jgi:HD-GYP domain-containing protein (c-di-GMP phosphodiesterase class II)
MSKGIQLKKEYISRLKALNIKYIYVEDEISKGVDDRSITEIQIKKDCINQLETIWEKLICNTGKELIGAKEVAAKIMDDLLKQPRLVYCISGVREKSEMVYSHSLNVCAMSVLIAIRMKLQKKKIYEIAEGSLLHDIGFAKIPDEIKEKSKEKLNVAENREINLHTIYGYDYLEKEEWISKAAKEIILCHHEHLDGSGSPFGRKGDKLNIGCRIVAVCDTFDRMVYGIFTERLKVHEVIEYIINQADRYFDKEVVEIFNRSIAAYPNGTLVRTNEGETGIVLRQNENFSSRPVIRMLKDKYGKTYKSWVEKNLEQELSLFIEDTIE